jgi:hypothetical protein
MHRVALDHVRAIGTYALWKPTGVALSSDVDYLRGSALA